MFLIPILIGVAVGPTIDQGVNCVTGGDCRYTISAEAAINRNAGNKSAAAWCELYNGTVSFVDAVRWSPDSHRVFAQRNADHCEKWRLYETGELAKLKQQLPAIDYTAPEWNIPRRHQLPRSGVVSATPSFGGQS